MNTPVAIPEVLEDLRKLILICQCHMDSPHPEVLRMEQKYFTVFASIEPSNENPT